MPLTIYKIEYQTACHNARRMSVEDLITHLSSLAKLRRNSGSNRACLLAKLDAYADVLQARGYSVPPEMRGK